MVRLAVVGDKDIRPTVTVEVGVINPQPRTRMLSETCVDRDVLKSRNPITLRPEIVKQFRDAPAESIWTTEILAAATIRAPTGGIVIHVVDQHNVQPAVPVVIRKAGRSTP